MTHLSFGRPSRDMKLLALDTSTEACTAALWFDGETIERFKNAPREHSELILTMIESLLGEAGLILNQIDAVAYGRGPGSFVGVRIAAAVTQGIAFAADLPVLPVSSLATLAQGIGEAKVLACFDARMGEVYWAQYQRDASSTMQLQGEEQVLAPDIVKTPDDCGSWVGAGSGWKTFANVLEQRLPGVQTRYQDALPHASDAALLGVKNYNSGFAVPAEQALPVYLRNNVARKPKPNAI